MAASVPVLATDVGGIREIVVQNRTGVLINAPPTSEQLAEAIGALLDDPHRRRDLAAAGRRRYEDRFTADPWVRRTRALYDVVLSEVHGGGSGRGTRRPALAVSSQIPERDE